MQRIRRIKRTKKYPLAPISDFWGSNFQILTLGQPPQAPEQRETQPTGVVTGRIGGVIRKQDTRHPRTEAVPIEMPSPGFTYEAQPTGVVTGRIGAVIRPIHLDLNAIRVAFDRFRTIRTAGINFRVEPKGVDETTPQVIAPPYGKIAVGTGAGAVGLGVATYFAPVPTPVKVIMGAISAMLAGGTVYSAVKYNEVRRIQAGADVADKITKLNAQWLSRTREFGHLIQNAVAGQTEEERKKQVQVVNYIKYNKYSQIVKFKNAFQSTGITDEEGNTETVAEYPDWIDQSKITTGKNEWNEWANDLKNRVMQTLMRIAPFHVVGAKETYYLTKQLSPEIKPEDTITRNKFKYIGENDYGMQSNDCLFNTNYCSNILTCSSIPQVVTRPVFFHVMSMFHGGASDESSQFAETFININNYDEHYDSIDRLPRDSIIIGSRVAMNGTDTESLFNVWKGYSNITYTDLESMLQKYENLSYGEAWNLFNSSRQEFENFFHFLILTYRPDLSFLSLPAIPATLEGDIKQIPLLLNKASNFIQSALFQPFDLNYNYLLFTLDQFIAFRREVVFRGIELPDNSIWAKILKIASVVISVVCAVVMTVASFGTDTIPAWAMAVTVILSVVASGLSLASQYLEGGVSELPAGIAQAVAGLWSTLKGNLTGLADKLNIHFNNSALAFLNGIEEKMGVVIDRVEPYINVIRDSLADIGLNLQDNYQYLNTYLKGLIPNFPTLDSSIARELQNYLVSNPALQGTNQAWMEVQERVKADIISKITEVDSNLVSQTGKQAITKLDILY